ncbi:serine hydrolase domain-containing protein [Colwellia sp. 20A7]|uniref:serine hydrolase domain-containing protein n=1 Tax=Colwellia sp. 20A7 TaxID=2689569 RepID=UPI00135BE5D7|nr:serine hydrolase [Colwellia sp. 20A7]
MKSTTEKKCQIHGMVEPGFESIKQLYEHNMQTTEENSQLCVYYQGDKVVDLWASTTEDDNFSPDSIINIFSSGKSLEAIAMASLVSKGLLSYDAKITQYWPEFGANGKEELTVADLMRHEAGLANFDTSLEMEDLFTESIKKNNVGRIIESQAQIYASPDGSKRQYHALTRGWIANEVFRRVDPTGRTIGEFLREDISNPLKADTIIGVKKHEISQISEVTPLGFGTQFLESLKPKFLGRVTPHNIAQIIGSIIKLVPSIYKKVKAGNPPVFSGITGIGFINTPSFTMGETPSANTFSSARGLAKIAAMMSAGGKWEGTEYLSEQAWKAMHENPVKADMGGLTITRFTQGGIDSFTTCTPDSTHSERALNQGREGFYGWMGFGGSIFQWHPELDIGFSFVPTTLHALDFLNERGKRYQTEILNCIAKISKQKKS